MGVADFSGYATKAGLECSDGRTIMPEAFKGMDGKRVPLVWQHDHDNPSNILGHAILEARPDGLYARGYFNDTKAGQTAKALVIHEDINMMSIYANKLVERAKNVFHGVVREVSLVLSGANPGALIDYVNLAHSDGRITQLEEEAVIYTGLTIVHGDGTAPAEKTGDGPTMQDVYDNMSDAEKELLHFMVNEALTKGAQSDSAEHSSDDTESEDDTVEHSSEDDTESEDDETDGDKPDEADLTHKEGNTEVTRNIFEQNGNQGEQTSTDAKHTLSHADVKGIVANAMLPGNTFRTAIKDYALSHGIDNIDIMFPDAKAISNTPDFISRRMAWVGGVLNGTRKTPFSRIKNYLADITQDEARAKGYIKGNMKKEEFFGITKRTTAPTTIYKKQKLDRDDILDITDLDIVAWLKAEMRIMMDEEAARAILIGDGRDVDDDDKVKDPAGAVDGIGIRSILNDDEMYVTTVNVNILDANSSYNEVVEEVMRAMRFYKGSGSPTFYTTQSTLTEMLLAKDANLRRYYLTVSDLAVAMGVSSIQPVEAMESVPGLLGIIVNLQDYTVGTDKGGEVNMFDDFDIDYNQQKYLMETRFSGALTKYKSALVINSTASANVLVKPITAPTFVESTGVVTIPTQTGVVYKNDDTSATLSAGAQTALAAGATLNVIATPASGYYFETNAEDEFSFTRPAA